MLNELTRRFRKWMGRPEVPVGDLADDTWQRVGPLPPARPLGLGTTVGQPGTLRARLKTPAPVRLELIRGAPPIPRDAQARRRTAELPPAEITPKVTYDADAEQREWQELLSAAKTRAAAPARRAPRAVPAARTPPAARTTPAPREDLEWQAAIARAKSGRA